MTTTPVRSQAASAGAGPSEAERTGNRTGKVPEAAGRARGRHRRPRPRKVLFAAGGFALAVGALSLLRPASDSGVDTAQAEPRLGPTADTRPDPDHATNPAVTASAAPRPASSAAAPMGGGPTAGSGAVPGASPTSAVRTPSGPYGPRTTSPAEARPDTPAAPPTPRTTPEPPRPPGPTAPPAPGPTTAPPAPGPTSRPGLCLPVIGLCVDPLPGPAD
ncbi:hypothetical protein ABZY42_05170 [Streptomyces sp. NPDC006622]|uniref:hypothetical protein n=1 Tax=Streptomyces sp. NPDC006622 TaxID=3155459 RepID=UPI0033BF22F4